MKSLKITWIAIMMAYSMASFAVPDSSHPSQASPQASEDLATLTVGTKDDFEVFRILPQPAYRRTNAFPFKQIQYNDLNETEKKCIQAQIAEFGKAGLVPGDHMNRSISIFFATNVLDPDIQPPLTVAEDAPQHYFEMSDDLRKGGGSILTVNMTEAGVCYISSGQRLRAKYFKQIP